MMRVSVSFSGADERLNCEDLTSLSQLTEDVITKVLENRFSQSEIYTYIGSILISVNPYKPTGIYNREAKDRLVSMKHHMIVIGIIIVASIGGDIWWRNS